MGLAALFVGFQSSSFNSCDQEHKGRNPIQLDWWEACHWSVGLKNRVSPFMNYRASDGIGRAHNQSTNALIFSAFWPSPLSSSSLSIWHAFTWGERFIYLWVLFDFLLTLLTLICSFKYYLSSAASPDLWTRGDTSTHWDASQAHEQQLGTALNK